MSAEYNQVPAEYVDHIADTLERGADILETKGWTRGVYRDPYKGGYCAIGSILEALGHDWQKTVFMTSDKVRFSLLLARFALGFTQENELITWNDAQKTGEPVIERMKQTAKDLRNRAKPDA